MAERVRLSANFQHGNKAQRALWAQIESALESGKQLAFRLKSMTNDVDRNTLVPTMRDQQGKPLFGIVDTTVVNVEVEFDFDIPQTAQPATATMPSKLSEADIQKMRAMWQELHEKCFNLTDADMAAMPAWLDAWVNRIPCGGCKGKFKAKITDKFRPDFSSPVAIAKWSVAIHDDLNVELGKPVFGFEAAEKLYRK